MRTIYFLHEGRYYHTCTKCGANLDPGEKCDCDEERCPICGRKLQPNEKCDCQERYTKEKKR